MAANLTDVMDELDAISRRLKKLEEKLDDALDAMESSGSDEGGSSDSDGIPGWLKMVSAHPAAQGLLAVLGDKERISRLLERLEKKD